MIELWTWPPPIGQKTHIAMEQTGLAYEVKPVDISAGAQFSPEFWRSRRIIVLFQMSSIGPMFGQYYHFVHAPDELPYAIER